MAQNAIYPILKFVLQHDLPELDTVESERLRNFIFSLQEEKPFCVPVQIIK